MTFVRFRSSFSDSRRHPPPLIIWPSHSIMTPDALSNKNTTPELPLDVLDYVFEYLYPKQTRFVNKRAYRQFLQRRARAIRVIEGLCHRNLHVDPEPHPRQVTLRTYKRYFVTKYKPAWLQDFPKQAITLFGFSGPNTLRHTSARLQDDKAYVRNFYEFCTEFNMSREHLIHYEF